MSTLRRWAGGVAPLWSCTPPPPKTRKYDRLDIVNRVGRTVIVVSSQIEETLTHYVDKRTQPCTQHHGECWVDHREVGQPRYCAWLAVQLRGKDRVYLLSLTKVSVAVEPRLRDPALDLRGMELHAWRLHDHERSELHARLHMDVPREANPSECPDVRFAVERMWEAEDRPKGPAFQRPGPLQRAFAAAVKGGAE